MLNNVMGKKISELTTAAKPLSGGEIIPMNQNGSTVTASLSDVKSYTLGGSSLSGFPTLSGNNVFTGSNNTFGGGLSTENVQFTDPDIIKVGEGAGSTTGAFSLENIISIGNGTNSNIATEGGTVSEIVSIGHNSGNSLGNLGNCEKTVSIGYLAGGSLGIEGNATDVIAIGSESCYIGGSSGTLSNIISIGNNAGSNSGVNSGSSTDFIAIGSYAGFGAGSNLGSVSDIIAIGRSAGGGGVGVYGNVTNCVFVGLSSGYLQRSSKNTFVGDLTNTTSPSTATLSGCIALGYGAQPSVKNTIAIGSTSVPLSVVPGTSLATSLSGLRIMINGTYYTIPLLA